MHQSDWVGASDSKTPPQPRVFNPAPAKVDEKDRLRADLRGLLIRVPPSVTNGSFQQVATWKALHTAAEKVLSNARSTGQQLRTAINSMARYS